MILKLNVTLFLAMLTSAPCFAACDLVEYTEVKDWKPEAIEKAYCDDYDYSLRVLKETSDHVKTASNMNAYLNAYQGEVAKCNRSMGLYERTLKNLHGRDPPRCSQMPR